MHAVPELLPLAGGGHNIPPACGGALGPPFCDLPLGECLDARLTADRRVLAFTVDPVLETFERFVGHRTVRLPLRDVTLRRGRRLFVVVPEEVRGDPITRRTIGKLNAQINLDRAARRSVWAFSETAVRRQPMLEAALMIADCADARFGAGDRVRMLTHLVQQGGSACLEDCASFMETWGDPVAAVLAQVARKAVWVDLREPLGPFTRVHIAPRRRF